MSLENLFKRNQSRECTNCGTRIYNHEPRYRDTDQNLFCSIECREEYAEDNPNQSTQILNQESVRFGHMDLPLWQRLEVSEK